jgi:hypothetical protein
MQCRLRGGMICPRCKAEFRQGFTHCVDCDVELVQNQAEAVRHPLAKRIALSEKYGTRLWRGSDPHFYTELLWSLWDKKVACYGAPENPPIPKPDRGQQPVIMEPRGFEVWVSEEDLSLAKWVLDSASEEFEKNPPEERTASVPEREISPGTTGICPLCFAEFTTSSLNCPNCGVPLRLPQPDKAIEVSARLLCNIYHPKFIVDLRKALEAAGIPCNNANLTSGGIIPGVYYTPNYTVVVLEQDFERATRVMSQVLQRWEFEPSAGLRMGRDSLLPYGLEMAAKKGWDPEDISALVWSGENLGLASGIGSALQEHKIAYRIESQPVGMAKVFSHPEDEARAREIVREIVEGVPPE